MGDNGDFLHRCCMLLQRCNQRMTHLMVGDNALFNIREDGTLLFGACNDRFKGNQQVLLVHCLSAHTDGAKRSLIDQIGEISAYGTSGYLCNPVQVYILGELDVSGVDL